MKHGTWVVVADGQKVLFLQNRGDSEIIDLRVLDWRAQDNPATSDQGADRPGRAYDSGGPGRSAMEPTDWHQIAEDRFAQEVAGNINDAALAKRFSHLVIVAPPKALAEIRSHLHIKARESLVAEIAKDLTNHPVHKIEKILANV